MKKLILIAGVNGAGKSTLFQTLTALKGMPRVNSDEILKEFGDWRQLSDILIAGKIASQNIQSYLSNNISFNQETTLCGKSIIKEIKTAKEKGYLIELHYVGVNSVEIAKKRVHNRIINGGHGVSDHDIERRYITTFLNLKQILPLCDLAAFYDNTKQFRRFAIYKNGNCVRLSHSVPDWYIFPMLFKIKILIILCI